MVAFSFKARFVEPIRAKTKTQTIRRRRKRPAMAGDSLQLYHGPRFRPVKVGVASCTAAGPITLNFTAGEVVAQLAHGCFRAWSSADELDAFAVADGFEDWGSLRAFWRETHQALDSFSGDVAMWADTFQAAE